MAAITAQLVEHCGGAPSVTQRLLIGRAARDMLTLELLDRKLADGRATDHDIRAHGAISNRVRLALRDLGWKGAAQRGPTLAEHLAAKVREREGTAA